jgi:hypothetical protein
LPLAALRWRSAARTALRAVAVRFCGSLFVVTVLRRFRAFGASF